jgi:hypothetical protein
MHEFRQFVRDFYSSAPKGRLPEGSRDRYEALLNAHSTLRQNLPDVTDSRGLQLGETISYANPELVQAHLTLHVCTILLCNVQLSVRPDSSSRENVVGAAHAMARIASRIRPTGTLVPIHAYLNSIVSPLNISPLKESR